MALARLARGAWAGARRDSVRRPCACGPLGARIATGLTVSVKLRPKRVGRRRVPVAGPEPPARVMVGRPLLVRRGTRGGRLIGPSSGPGPQEGQVVDRPRLTGGRPSPPIMDIDRPTKVSPSAAALTPQGATVAGPQGIKGVPPTMARMGVPSPNTHVIPGHHLRPVASRPVTGPGSITGPIRPLADGRAEPPMVAPLPVAGRPRVRARPAGPTTPPGARVKSPPIGERRARVARPPGDRRGSMACFARPVQRCVGRAECVHLWRMDDVVRPLRRKVKPRDLPSDRLCVHHLAELRERGAHLH